MGRHGENIRKRADGRWEARYIQYYDTDGKAVYRCIYGKTYLEAKQKRKLAMSEIATIPRESGELLKLTFSQLAEEWARYKKGQVKQSTYANYMNLIEKHLLPEMGDVPLSALTTQYIEQFLQKKMLHGRLDGKGGLSSKSVSDIRALLKIILKYAKKTGYSCPSDLNFSAPAGHLPKIEVFDKIELEKLEKVLLADLTPMHLGVLAALYGGLRIGEVCGLQWQDFHFEEGTVSINKTVIRIIDTEKNSAKKTKVIIEKPKTECSNRIIPLPDAILPYFKEAAGEKEHYILTGKSRFMEPRVCLENYKKILKQAGVKEHTFHALRHTFATRCVENDFDVKSLSEIMGHSNISITMQRYVHPSMEQKREQMNKLVLNINCGQNYGQKNVELL